MSTVIRGKAKGQGQWALGHREPLNANEQFKKDDDGLNVRARVENIYAHKGFASIDPSDLRGRLRWWGLYTQRRQGIDGGRTAVLEPHELDDEHFMLRIRMDGGQLDAAQLRAVAEVSTRFARDTADVTDRQNVQLHWVRIEDVPEIWRTLEAVGLSTTEACGDTPRVILGSPVSGLVDEPVDVTAIIAELTDRYIGDPAYSNLPRKFKTSISWLPDVPYETNDVAFLGAVHPSLGPGFDLWVGGGLSTNPALAKRLGVWVAPDEVSTVWEGVIGIFRDYGYRRLRNRARLKFLVNDWGVERFRQVLEKEYLGASLPDLAAPPVPDAIIDHIGVHPQRDGRRYIGVAPTVGRVSGTILAKLADIAQRYGTGHVRTTPNQKLLVPNVRDADVPAAVDALADIGLYASPSQWRRTTMACTGIEYCKLAIVDTKDTAAALITELERRVPTLDSPISIHVNGCPNACARTQTADIGLKGQIITVAGKQVPGFQVHLGGGLALHAGFGRKLRGLKVAASELDDYVERLAIRYLAQRVAAEAFAEWVLRADEEDLR